MGVLQCWWQLEAYYYGYDCGGFILILSERDRREKWGRGCKMEVWLLWVAPENVA